MFLASGEETAPVDVMQDVWTGAWPTNRSPRLEGASLDGKTAQQNIHLQSGQTYTARVLASDPDHDPLSYRWEVMPESTETKIGGDAESKPTLIPDLIADPRAGDISLKAPNLPGPYRLFAYVFDGHGHAAHVNIPFFVDEAPKSQQAADSIGHTTSNFDKPL